MMLYQAANVDGISLSFEHKPKKFIDIFIAAFLDFCRSRFSITTYGEKKKKKKKKKRGRNAGYMQIPLQADQGQ